MVVSFRQAQSLLTEVVWCSKYTKTVHFKSRKQIYEQKNIQTYSFIKLPKDNRSQLTLNIKKNNNCITIIIQGYDIANKILKHNIKIL